MPNFGRFLSTILISVFCTMFVCNIGCSRRDTASKAATSGSDAFDPSKFQDDDVVLRVNGRELLWKELQFGVNIHYAKIRARLGPMAALQNDDIKAGLYKKILPGYVYQFLMLDEADRLGIKLSEPEKNEAAAMAPKMAKTTGLSDKNLETHIPYKDFFVKQAENLLLVGKLEKQEVSDKIKISDADIAEGFEALKKRNEEAVLEEKKYERLINDIHAQLTNGSDFADLARKYSQCGITGPKGGYIGTFTRAELDDEQLNKLAFGLKEGEISDVIKNSDGFLILKGQNVTSNSVDLSQIILMVPAQEPLPDKDEMANRLNIEAVKKGKLALQEKVKASAKIVCPLFPDMTF